MKNKNWLKESLKINKKMCYLMDFSDDEFIADKIKREVLDNGAEYATVRVRKNAYFETYPEGTGYYQKVYAVYARWLEDDE